MKSLICGISLLTLVASVSFANETTAPVVNPEANTAAPVAPVTEVKAEATKVEKKINKKAKKAKKVEMKTETAPAMEAAPAAK